MRKKAKRILSMVLVFSMLMSLFSIAAYAEETGGESGGQAYVPSDPYVLNFSNNAIEGYEDYDASKYYFSPYRTYIKVWNDRHDLGPDEPYGINDWGWCTASVLNMINTSKIGTVENPTGPYASIPVYCVDAFTNGIQGHKYRRVNMEDSGHFSDEAAGRVRAIYMNSFPYVDDVGQIQAAVNAWIRADAARQDAYGQITDLNHYEVISATQSIIWTITNAAPEGEEQAEFVRYAGYNGYDDEWDWYPGYTLKDPAWYDENCIYDLDDNPRPGALEGEVYTSASANNKKNIEAVARYLESLEPMSPQNVVISEAAFADTDVSYEWEPGGTYKAVIKAKVAAEIQNDDDLTLSAVFDDDDQVEDPIVSDSVALVNGTNEYTLTVSGMKYEDIANTATVILAIDGVQVAGDVFLFDPNNGRIASQTMAGYDYSAMPVHVQLSVDNVPPQEMIDISCVKVWEDADNQDEKRPDSVTVQLKADGEAYGDAVVLSADNQWFCSWNDLDPAIVYTLEEISEIASYTSDVKGIIDADGNIAFTITNTYTPEAVKPVEYTEVTVNKVWNDNNNAAGKRPDSIFVALYADGNALERAELTAEMQWTHTFIELEKFNSDGIEIVYTVDELEVPEGYSKSVAGTTITNTYNTPTPPTPPAPTPTYTSVSVTKVWDDADNQDGLRPESITVQLLRNGRPYAAKVLSEGSWSATWTGLDDFFTWTVAEFAVPEGYISSVSASGNSYTITNTHVPYTSLSVQKVWDDEDDKDGIRPDSVQVELLENGAGTGTIATLDDANGWTYTWTQLNGESQWSVSEINVPEGYTSSVSTVDGSVVVTNTYVPEEPPVEPEDPQPEPPATEPEEPVVEPEPEEPAEEPEEEDPLFGLGEDDTPLGDKEVDDPLYDMGDGDIPYGDMEVGDPNAPKTSDNSMLALWLTLVILSGLGLTGLTVAEKRRR